MLAILAKACNIDKYCNYTVKLFVYQFPLLQEHGNAPLIRRSRNKTKWIEGQE
jgi:hypothetical protein